ncbi:2,3-bisphosphoglycerate-independent phosphoglycerate mutase [Halalkalicoccus jeotgali]|uniref:2,3-bisphosphoglycerate-independent phosphoglycerate mutase n=1 Tax=Halalkalicoccus jeotgali (strain DSM 18796 / CECT 7217 / JCM 14584 / KCTC 4019 / B3) TaxID=795797 RepID=D8JAJ1_HALJB|nr:2,3-bisphosphoglycerate-independent phosphoglycerate mutase [Halalkalicoccus jeotgali]ADJ14713.1 phosphoglyceromutase [Halalkalicoccus jeotgali B3]ELY39509.1 phosphoglyceromutase [Halalkalicoccus jeotgali B3]
MDGALIVLDGWGLREPGDDGGRDAVASAETPTFDRIRESGAFGRLDPTGRRVGLPEGQMGNSEVGHLNIGAGRVVKQAYTRINDAVSDGAFRTNEALAGVFDHVEGSGGRVHFLGLVSAGGVHSDQKHLHALIEWAADRGVEAVTHAFTDGRDTDPKSGAGYLRELEEVIEKAGTGEVATVSGRYYAMDRDTNWERTRKAYDAMVNREAEYTAPSGTAAVEAAYDRGETDEFVEPTLVESGPTTRDGDSTEQRSAGDRLAIRDDDAAIFFNFRGDRGRQLTRMLQDIRPEWDVDTPAPDVHLVAMTQYDKTFDVPVAFPPNQPADTLGEVLADRGKTQLRTAESEKYAHVTYFLNGGREIEFDGEIREIVSSPDVPTYDLQPQMSAPELTDNTISIVKGEEPDVVVLNYANPDMVGHTGDFEAAVEAVEAVDAQLDRLLETLSAHSAHVIVTADHGNADDMGTEESPHTAHTYNPVPMIYLDPDGTGGEYAVREGGSLCDLAPTLLERIGIDRPEAMTGEPLLIDRA